MAKITKFTTKAKTIAAVRHHHAHHLPFLADLVSTFSAGMWG